MLRQIILVLFGLLGLGIMAACQSSRPIETPAAANESGDSEAVAGEDQVSMTVEDQIEVNNAEVDPDDHLVCRRETITGSHFQRTVCRTVAEGREMQEEAQRTMRGMTRAGDTQPSGD